MRIRKIKFPIKLNFFLTQERNYVQSRLPDRWRPVPSEIALYKISGSASLPKANPSAV